MAAPKVHKKVVLWAASMASPKAGLSALLMAVQMGLQKVVQTADSSVEPLSLPWEWNSVAMKAVLWAWRWVDHLVTNLAASRVAMWEQP